MRMIGGWKRSNGKNKCKYFEFRQIYENERVTCSLKLRILVMSSTDSGPCRPLNPAHAVERTQKLNSPRLHVVLVQARGWVKGTYRPLNRGRINARKAFKDLRNHEKRAAFDQDLLGVIESADFQVMAVVIDKAILREKYGEAAAHPYHLGLGYLLQRYAGYLNFINRVGDVIAEARGGVEDRLLKESYNRVYERGIWGVTNAKFFQSALTSSELKLKPKTANVAGLQLADLLGHPTKMWIFESLPPGR